MQCNTKRCILCTQARFSYARSHILSGFKKCGIHPLNPGEMSDQHKTDQASCPAYGKSCNHCGKPNHFQAVCRQRKSQTTKGASLAAMDEAVESTDSDEWAFMLEEIGTVHHNQKGQYFAKVDFAHRGTAVSLDC